MKYLLLASMLGAANAVWTHETQFTVNDHNIIAIDPIIVDDGTELCNGYATITDQSLCLDIRTKYNELDIPDVGSAGGLGWGPAGCWLEDNSQAMLGAKNSIWWGSSGVAVANADTRKAKLHFCIGGDGDAGGDAGGGDGGGGADPCPIDRSGLTPADYINKQCCDC